jgi:hypothetical protein
MFQKAPEPAHLDGIMPLAPLNRLSMLTDYGEPSEREVACPNHQGRSGADRPAPAVPRCRLPVATQLDHGH